MSLFSFLCTSVDFDRKRLFECGGQRGTAGPWGQQSLARRRFGSPGMTDLSLSCRAKSKRCRRVGPPSHALPAHSKEQGDKRLEDVQSPAPGQYPGNGCMEETKVLSSEERVRPVTRTETSAAIQRANSSNLTAAVVNASIQM